MTSALHRAAREEVANEWRGHLAQAVLLTRQDCESRMPSTAVVTHEKYLTGHSGRLALLDDLGGLAQKVAEAKKIRDEAVEQPGPGRGRTAQPSPLALPAPRDRLQRAASSASALTSPPLAMQGAVARRPEWRS